MQPFPCPIHLIVDNHGYIRFTEIQERCNYNSLALFSLQDLVKLHFLFIEFAQRDAIFLFEAGGTGFYKARKNCIPGDHWCIGVGLTGIQNDGSRVDLSNDWFYHESRRVAYRVNADVRVWITWPAMRKIINTLNHELRLILEDENRRVPQRFVPSNDPMLQLLGPSPSNAIYLKAVCEALFTTSPIPVPRPMDDLYTALGRASTESSITPRTTKIPKNQYASFYKMYATGVNDTTIAMEYGVSLQTVSRTRYSINNFIYNCRERAWNMWDVWFEGLAEKYRESLRGRTS